MNRLISTGVEHARIDRLPPPKREKQARILFFSVWALGWATYAKQLEDYAATRDDIDACHIRCVPNFWVRLVSRPIPGTNHPLLQHHTTWRWILANWVRRHIPLERFDVIHVSPMALGRGLAQRRAGARFRLSGSLDTTGVQYRRELAGLAPDPAHVVAEEAAAYRACDLLAPWSQWAADSLVQDYGADRDRIQICRPAVQAHSSPSAAKVARQADPASILRIVFVGNDWERKGGPLLLRWHQQYFKGRAELHVVSGKAPVDATAENVVWHGYVPNDRLLAEVLPEMDLFVFPTQHDMLGIVVIEAAALGLPAITSRLAAIPELVREGETGFLCDPKDETGFVAMIDRLLSDRALLQKMSEASRTLALREFTPAAQFGPLFDRFVTMADAIT